MNVSSNSARAAAHGEKYQKINSKRIINALRSRSARCKWQRAYGVAAA